MKVICSICHRNFFSQRKRNYLVIRCGHVFHTDCLKTWFASNRSCPYCRYSCENNDKEAFEIFFDQQNTPGGLSDSDDESHSRPLVNFREYSTLRSNLYLKTKETVELQKKLKEQQLSFENKISNMNLEAKSLSNQLEEEKTKFDARLRLLKRDYDANKQKFNISITEYQLVITRKDKEIADLERKLKVSVSTSTSSCSSSSSSSSRHAAAVSAMVSNHFKRFGSLNANTQKTVMPTEPEVVKLESDETVPCCNPPNNPIVIKEEVKPKRYYYKQLNEIPLPFGQNLLKIPYRIEIFNINQCRRTNYDNTVIIRNSIIPMEFFQLP